MVELKLGSVHASNVFLGGVRAKSVFYGATRVWPRMVPWTDLFERTGTSDLGPDWTSPLVSSRQLVISAGRAVNPTISGNPGRWGAYSGVANSYSTPEWEDYKVTIQLAAPANTAENNYTSIIFGWDGVPNSTSQCIALMMSTGSNCYIVTNNLSNADGSGGNLFSVSGNAAIIQNSTTTDIGTTSLVVFQKIGNTFSAYKNGALLMPVTTWTGLSGATTRKRPILCVEGNSPFGLPEYHSPLIASVTVEDL